MEDNLCPINDERLCNFDPKTHPQVPAYKQPATWASIFTMLAIIVGGVWHYTNVKTDIAVMEAKLDSERVNREMVNENMMERFAKIDENQRITAEILHDLEAKMNGNREDIIRLQNK